MKKKWIIFIAIATIGLVFLYVNQCPIVVMNEKSTVLNNSGNEQSLSPLEQVNFKGESIAYLIFSKEDLNELPEKIVHGKVLYCDDNTVLKKLKKYFVFSTSNGDMATCESKIVIYNNGKKVFQSAIVVTPNLLGIQNEVTGWSESKYPKELTELFSSFEKSNALFLSFN